MCAHKVTEPRTRGSQIEALLTWVGGGERRELDEHHERSAHAIAGVVVILNATLAWLVTTVDILEAARWPVLAVVPFTLVFGLLVGAITRGIASGPLHGIRGIVGRALVAIAVGMVVGEFAALAVFSGSIDRRLELQAARNADSAPGVVQASMSLAQLRDTRVALDKAVDTARVHRDEALEVARCEYHPTPACPQTRITGVPGSGPETRTANELLADSQRELDAAVVARDRQAADLDLKIGHGERVLSTAHQSAAAEVDHGLGARWLAMQDLTLASAGALMLRLLTIAFFTLLSLLPLILRLWRGETTHDRHAKARAERERAELEAETAIAVKRAEVRAAAETMWAEQQLVQARLAVEAQTEIDRAQLRQRVDAALEVAKPVVEDVYLPIAAEAEAASLAAAELPDAAPKADAIETPNLPATVETPDVPATPVIPTIPDVTKAAARWIRPLVPGFVARAIDTSTHPLRTARQVFEEVEEITFALKRTRKIVVNTEESVGHGSLPPSAAIDSADDRDLEAHHDAGQSVLSQRLSAKRVDDLSLAQHEPQRGVTGRKGPAEVRAADGPRQLPPAQ
ncbi:DUF4407 domain-containing protein [Mycobacterium sp.]|uniref:DUF4407 domain-containing protein n=1 Tax=Mycobacterium sp. TaxID=1785 RepID=UPI002B6EC441|nr:DUF4407 domain-containing protein [Mycobacterium sp.]HXB85299.1 DUF4407 domain-containing protein [Mycobacterium sp.]